MAVYARTKAFVLFFSKALQYELAGTGVHVAAACQGPAATSFLNRLTINALPKDIDSSRLVVQRALKPFDRRQAIAYSGSASVQVARWLSRLLPRAIVVRLTAIVISTMGLHG
jgi:short-subunit dehydrogenase